MEIEEKIRSTFAVAANFREGWNPRADFIARLVPDGAIVCDIGCGPIKHLSRALDPSCTYLACDLKAWDENTETCDLNTAALPVRSLERADVVTLLGVLEYVTDAKSAIAAIAKFTDHLIFSYHPAELRAEMQPMWPSEMSLFDIHEAVRAASFDSLKIYNFEHRQLVFEAKRDRPARARG